MRLAARLLLPFTILLPFMLAALVGLTLHQEKVLGRSLALGLGSVILLIVGLLLIPVPEWVEAGLGDRLSYVLEQAMYSNLGPG
jgi:hypothetical protein